jgi:hypothetical protein
MSELDVRGVMTNLQNDFSNNPELLKQFSSTPRLFLQSYGLPLAMQKKLALEGEPSPQVRCFCATFISILTTTITTTFEQGHDLD